MPCLDFGAGPTNNALLYVFGINSIAEKHCSLPVLTAPLAQGSDRGAPHDMLCFQGSV